jgi:predicted DNA-binding WGR domain protein
LELGLQKGNIIFPFNNFFPCIPIETMKRRAQFGSADGPKAKRELRELEFVLIGQTETPKADLKIKIGSLGGKLVTKIQTEIAAIISTEKEVEKLGKRMKDAKVLDIQVVPESFFDAVEKSGEPIEKIKSMCISDWGSDPLVRISKKARQCHDPKNGPTKATAVDPDIGLKETVHIYMNGQDLYCVLLGLADKKRNKNSYLKMQVLESDTGRYWVFRSWGRVGTAIGDDKLESFTDKVAAITHFESLYQGKTKNTWENRNIFVELTGNMYPIDFDGIQAKKLHPIQ